MARRISRRSAIARLLDDSESPVFVLDAQRRIAYANTALGQWLALDPDKMAGLQCLYSSESASPVAGLCPPPEAFEGRACSALVWRALPNGETESRHASFFTLEGTAGKNGSIVAILDVRLADVAERPQASQDGAATLETDSKVLHERLWRIRGEISHEYHLDQLIGETPAMRRVQQLARAAAGQSGNVLILGAEGTGREQIARGIHGGLVQRVGAESQPPPATPPMATLSARLLDSELVETTVATYLRRCAALEFVGLPTLLILDADVLDAKVQESLFGLLSVPELQLRCISTAHQSLTGLSSGRAYHEGLAYILSGLEIKLPGLSERREDVPLLAQHFVEVWNSESERQVQGFSEEAIAHFLVYPWTFHLRELQQLVFEACDAATSPWIDVDTLPFVLRAAVDAAVYPAGTIAAESLDALLAETETQAIVRALEVAQGNRAQAARLLQVSRSRLLRRIAHLGLDRGSESSTDPPAAAMDLKGNE